MTGGKVTEITRPGTGGELALRPGWPSMFRGYLHDEQRYAPGQAVANRAEERDFRP